MFSFKSENLKEARAAVINSGGMARDIIPFGILATEMLLQTNIPKTKCYIETNRAISL